MLGAVAEAGYLLESWESVKMGVRLCRRGTCIPESAWWCVHMWCVHMRCVHMRLCWRGTCIPESAWRSLRMWSAYHRSAGCSEPVWGTLIIWATGVCAAEALLEPATHRQQVSLGAGTSRPLSDSEACVAQQWIASGISLKTIFQSESMAR